MKITIAALKHYKDYLNNREQEEKQIYKKREVVL